MKCRYLDEITGNRGIVFATGTPVSNSMTEMFTMMRYLQRDTLDKKHLNHFDAWASTFGERLNLLPRERATEHGHALRNSLICRS